MKIIFFGTPEFAVPSLSILHENGYEIAAVVTAPGKKAGRGLQIKEPAIKLFADQAGIKTFQPEKLNTPEFISEIKLLNADLFIVVAFRMLPESIWKMPPAGTFNLHSSLLPQYRGAAPINRAIMNGETETGVTTFFLKHEIDTGNILFREKTTIPTEETAGELHDRLKIIGAQLVLKTVKAIENGTITEIPQNELGVENHSLKTAPKLFTEDCIINWNSESTKIHNQVRGLSPFPGAFTFLEDTTGFKIQLKIYRTRLTATASSGEPGTLELSDGKFFINCHDELLEILELQMEGKKRLSARDFLIGFRKEKNYKCIAVN